LKKISVPLTWLEPDKGSFTGKQVVLKNALGLKEPVTLYAFIGDEVNQGFLATYRSIAIIVLFLSMVASVAVAWLIARKGVEPLKRIEEEVGELGSHTLHKRIKLLDLPIELTGLVSALNQTLDRLEDSFNRMSTFSADIAHELRTPIANVLGEIEVILSRPRMEAEYRETLSSTLEECERIAQIIESLLFLARAENFKKELNLEPVQVKSDIQALIDFFEPSASEKGITIFAFSKSDSPLTAVLAEKILFQRVLANLISNAIRYTNNGGKIIIKYESLDKEVIITVSDNGVGIAPEHLTNIFDRFYRVDPSREHCSGGFGLGLTIVKTIVEVHGGKIEVKSKVGQGTDVEIRWPAALSSI
jgi:two-component system heavy metal sensor histidine kinase CusS